MDWFANIRRSIVSGLAELSPSCGTAARLQSEALDHKLTWRQRLGLRLHLVLCKWCRRYGKQIGFVHNVVHSYPDEVTSAIPQQLSDEARERIRQRLRADQK
jgi:hypothetical protein